MTTQHYRVVPGTYVILTSPSGVLTGHSYVQKVIPVSETYREPVATVTITDGVPATFSREWEKGAFIFSLAPHRQEPFVTFTHGSDNTTLIAMGDDYGAYSRKLDRADVMALANMLTEWLIDTRNTEEKP